MKILFLADYNCVHMESWINWFAQNEHDVTLIYRTEPTGKNIQYHKNIHILKCDGILPKSLSHTGQIRKVDFLLSTRKIAKYADKIISQNTIDIVHCHALAYGFIGSFIKSHVPIVFTPLACSVAIHAQKNIIMKHLAKRAYKKCTCVTGDSKYIQDAGYTLGAKKQHNYIIQNGVDTDIFTRHGKNYRQKLHIKPSDFVILSSRKPRPLYNHDIIYQAFKIAYEQDKSLRLLCFDNGYYTGDGIITLPSLPLSHTDMPYLHRTADICLSIPSSDSSPRTIYESLLCGTPCLVSDLSWSHETLGDIISRTPIDAEQIAQNILKIKSNYTLYKQNVLNAHTFIQDNFGYQKKYDPHAKGIRNINCRV